MRRAGRAPRLQLEWGTVGLYPRFGEVPGLIKKPFDLKKSTPRMECILSFPVGRQRICDALGLTDKRIFT